MDLNMQYACTSVPCILAPHSQARRPHPWVIINILKHSIPVAKRSSMAPKHQINSCASSRRGSRFQL